MNVQSNQAHPPAAIHVDLDGASDIFRMWGWRFEGEDTVFETGLRNALDLFEANGVRATLFVIADSLDQPRKRALVEEAMRRGHEVASHTVTHPDLLKQDTARRQSEISGSRERLERELGVKVRGFRAPGYRLDRECIEMLAASGYAWDASAFPTPVFSGRLRTPVERLLAPHRPVDGSEFLELPLPDHRPWPVPFNPSYSHLTGLTYFRWGLKRAHRRGLPLVMLFHLIDFSDPLPAGQLRGWKSRIATLSNISGEKKRRGCQQMLDEIKARYRIVPTCDLIAEVESQLAAAPAALRRPTAGSG
jgi:peptidoglycan/xylan/chitin deacetylase (PgdA/CDA1 family)